MQGPPTDRRIECTGSEARKRVLPLCGVATGIIPFGGGFTAWPNGASPKQASANVIGMTGVLVFISGDSRKDLARLSRQFTKGTNRPFRFSSRALRLRARDWEMRGNFVGRQRQLLLQGRPNHAFKHFIHAIESGVT